MIRSFIFFNIKYEYNITFKEKKKTPCISWLLFFRRKYIFEHRLIYIMYNLTVSRAMFLRYTNFLKPHFQIKSYIMVQNVHRPIFDNLPCKN